MGPGNLAGPNPLNRRLQAALVAGLLAATSTAAAGGMPDTTQPGTVIAPLPSEQALLVTGPIGPDFESRIRALLHAHPRTNLVIVRSPGGMRYQALKAAELINEHGLTVRVAGRCASACALLWAAAQSREMTVDSRLGLHTSRLELPLPLPEAVTRHIIARNDRQTDAVLRSAGFPQSIIAEGGRTPPTSMSWYGPLELKHGGVPFTLLDRRRPTRPAGSPASGVAVSAAPPAELDVARQ